MAHAAQPLSDTHEPSLKELVSSAVQDLSTLVRDEIDLAKLELKESARHAGVGGGLLAGAALLGLLALILLSFAAVYGLVALGLHPALAFLIVAVVYLLIAGVLALVARRALSRVKGPERAVAQAKETRAALRPSH